MKIAILGTLLCVSFSELTSHVDNTRVVQCKLKNPETNKDVFQTISVNLSKRFVRTEHEKITLMSILNKYYPYQEDKNKNEIRSQRKSIWETYLTSSSKRRKLVPHLLRKLENSAQAH